MHEQDRQSRAGRPKSEEVEIRAQALLEVAEQALIELGYEHATLQIIAGRAKVSKKTIYAKYGGKPGLLRAVLDRMADRNMATDLRLLDRDDPAEGLYEWARMIMRSTRTPAAHAITAISMREGLRFPEFRNAMEEARKVRQQAPLKAYLERLQARGLIRPVDCDEIASLFLWALSQDMVAAVSAGTVQPLSDKEADEKARRIAKLIARGLAPGAD
ncbi:putative TetR family transcriptional regulator [Sphingobium herbicidovorans NBRC 16415]|uniref:TetR family transcriptional regulator n=1 Tax=Sphingobium herbicidovorans (strain ATCC 700291 / DSM 11019 / CCUG 56400 / KCTC 2939 / LMG 18315 / NBRC 16415 / MH) TaxID=1219045 RepID=A0A086P658_SPHHM|nr:TetR/AcrR family transcriptional regulator [Sphingobium herbicidovorans]KFG88876.1 putative TetR family transcriptional regulator [Sphingobium herbicidovorans NBRC 16415]